MPDFVASLETHNHRMSELALKYIGKQEMDRGMAMPDLWFKKQWYINRVRDLSVQAGRCSERLRRCKLNSPTWKRYETVERELSSLADELSIDLISLGHH